ncbi:TonB-dependent receptor plug domain-containing protein [Chryseobacterium sp. GP-SGM7]|uniref:TonB-dependent receptor plug domain-containing protein n=1 Tax=Chryseobacterium sp. GP-SGM7 TaxID=3411323 RepID=UPI003B946C4E
MKITIKKPCHENWEAMTQHEKGRFCSVCSKTVRDFTNDSDDKIVEILSKSESKNICGNFYHSQLNRNMNYSFINALFSKFAVGFILTAGGIVSLHAQEKDSVKISALSEIQGKLISVSSDSQNVTASTRGMPSSIYDSSEPIWLVDGKITDAKNIKDFDVKKIKKIDILKGVQAIAIYGSKAKNGVILVTMKKRFRDKK